MATEEAARVAVVKVAEGRAVEAKAEEDADLAAAVGMALAREVAVMAVVTEAEEMAGAAMVEEVKEAAMEAGA